MRGVEELPGPDEWRPDEMYAAVERRRILDGAVSVERHRTLLRLRYTEGWTLAAIAASWGVSEAAVCAMHGRALRRLRASLAGMGIESLTEI